MFSLVLFIVINSKYYKLVKYPQSISYLFFIRANVAYFFNLGHDTSKLNEFIIYILYDLGISNSVGNEKKRKKHYVTADEI